MNRLIHSGGRKKKKKKRCFMKLKFYANVHAGKDATKAKDLVLIFAVVLGLELIPVD